MDVRKVKSRVVTALVAVSLAGSLCGFSSVAFGEDAPAGSMSFWEKTKVTGTVDVNYNYNINRPTTTAAAAAKNAYRGFDVNPNTFNIGLVELAIENSPNDWVSFRTDLDFGRDAGIVQATEAWGTATSTFNLQQAYIRLKTHVGNGLNFKVGKFVTMHGAEVIEAAANTNISRGFLFNYAIPFTHTGILASYSFADWINLDLGVVNGWNSVVDTNNGKSVHAMFTIKPMDKVVLTVGGTVGPETAGKDGPVRALVDSVLTYTLNDQWNFVLNYDIGRDNGLAAGGTKGIADWQGVAGYINWKPFDKFGLSLRGEYFKDDTVNAAGTTGMTAGALTGTTASKKIYEGTLTSHYYLADGLDLRFEYRHDQGDQSSFLRGTGASRKFQDTIASQLVYAF